MQLVAIESPYAGNIEENVKYAKEAMNDCLSRGEAPYASHLLLTRDGVLDDNDSEERELGISVGFSWGDKADKRVVYMDLGISSGMQRGIDRAKEIGQEVGYRSLDDWGEDEVNDNRKEYDDILTIIKVHGDESNGYYLNGEKIRTIHANDRYMISGFYEGLMLDENINITEIKKVYLSQEQHERVYCDNSFTEYTYSHPDKLETYEKVGELNE